jgi:hypothetical protein
MHLLFTWPLTRTDHTETRPISDNEDGGNVDIPYEGVSALTRELEDWLPLEEVIEEETEENRDEEGDKETEDELDSEGDDDRDLEGGVRL